MHYLIGVTCNADVQQRGVCAYLHIPPEQREQLLAQQAAFQEMRSRFPDLYTWQFWDSTPILLTAEGLVRGVGGEEAALELGDELEDQQEVVRTQYDYRQVRDDECARIDASWCYIDHRYVHWEAREKHTDVLYATHAVDLDMLPCASCGQPYAKHEPATGKCLFGPGVFT